MQVSEGKAKQEMEALCSVKFKGQQLYEYELLILLTFSIRFLRGILGDEFFLHLRRKGDSPSNILTIVASLDDII